MTYKTQSHIERENLMMKVKLNINRIPVYIIIAQLVYVCIVRLLIDNGGSGSLTLVCDVFNVILALFLIYQAGKTKRAIAECRPIVFLYLLMLIFGTFSAIVEGYKGILWFWSVRNFGRFFIFFVACCAFFETADYAMVKKIILNLGLINWILAMIQYFVLGCSGDYIGGLFGTTGGAANTWMNSFLVVLMCIQLSDFFTGEGNTANTVLIIINEISIAVVAELKFLFIEIAISLIVCMIVTRKTKKVIEKISLIVLGFFVIVGLSIPILYKLFPMFDDFFSLEMIFKSATESYTGQGDLGRATAIPTIISQIFNGDIFKTLFGIGLGNAEYSQTQTIFQSQFYLRYIPTKYFWFSDAVVMIQNGIVGVICYLCVFAYLIKTSWHGIKVKDRYAEMRLTCVLLAVISSLLFIYNISLNTESAYIIYAFLAFGIVANKRKTNGVKLYGT